VRKRDPDALERRVRGVPVSFAQEELRGGGLGALIVKKKCQSCIGKQSAGFRKDDTYPPRPPPPPQPPPESSTTLSLSSADIGAMNAAAARSITRCVPPCVGRADCEYPSQTSYPPLIRRRLAFWLFRNPDEF
jgi:hypothetical protein